MWLPFTTNNSSPDESRAIKELRNESSLVILPADKGRTTVVMDRADYEDKMTALLSDQLTYKILQKRSHFLCAT